MTIEIIKEIKGITPTNNSFEADVNTFISNFPPCERNRQINRKKVEKIAKSIMEIGVFMPIAVNAYTLHQCDGHHRVAAAVYMQNVLKVNVKIPFFFIYPLVDEFKALLALNNVGWKWTSTNYGQSAFEHSEEFRAICAFAEQYGIINPNTNEPKLRILSAYLGKNIESLLKDGDFHKLAMSDVEWKHANVNAVSANKMLRIMGKVGSTNNIAPLVAAWSEFRKTPAFKSLVIREKGEVAAMTYIANKFDWKFAVSKTRFLRGFADAAAK